MHFKSLDENPPRRHGDTEKDKTVCRRFTRIDAARQSRNQNPLTTEGTKTPRKTKPRNSWWIEKNRTVSNADQKKIVIWLLLFLEIYSILTQSCIVRLF